MPSCQHFPACGGCQILDQDYPDQLQAKHAEIARHFADWPGLRIDPVLPSPRTEGYRHKVQLPFGFDPPGSGGSGPTIGCYGGRDLLFGKMGPVLEARLAPLGVDVETHTFADAGHSFLTDGHHPALAMLTWPLLRTGSAPEAN